MPKNPRKRPAPKPKPARPSVEQDPRTRITRELLLQLEPYLPISSLEKIMGKLGEVVVDKHRLPLKLVAPHISKDLFPIKTAEDLEQKLSAGVRRAVALAQSGSIPVGNKVLTGILATTFQESTAHLPPGSPILKSGRSAPAKRLTAAKGGK